MDTTAPFPGIQLCLTTNVIPNPMWAKMDAWLGGPMETHSIREPAPQRQIIALLIDSLYDMPGGVACANSHVYLVEARGALPDLTRRADEIHGTSDGFSEVAAQFKTKLSAVIQR